MDSRDALKAGILGGQQIVEGYLGDLTDADLFVRAIPKTNHIAWQLGHLLGAEHWMIDLVRPGSMPKLPEGFGAQYTNETAGSDDPSKFHTKAQYLEIFHAQRAATLAVLATLSDADFDQPAPAPLQGFLKTVGQVFSMQGTHWVMHAGQWAIIRRKLGKPPLF
jgi:DinB superfamily